MAAPIRVEITGLKELRRALSNDGLDLLREPYREMMENMRDLGEQSARSQAPRSSGKLASSITSRVRGGALPRSAQIKVSATSSSRRYPRYAYPKRLEFDPRSRHRDWLANALKSIQPRVESELSSFGRKLQARWGR